MINGVVIKILSKFVDERGWLMEIYREDEDAYNPVMAYVSVTKNGVIRGPHEHALQSDCFVFPGPGVFELHLWDRRKESTTNEQYIKMEVGESNPVMVIVPPGVVHGYKCISSDSAMCINLPDKLYKGINKLDPEVDEVRWEHDVNSPYKIT